MSTCAIIRCSTFGEPEQILADRLKPVFGDNLLIARSGPKGDIEHDVEKEVVLDDALLSELGLHPVDRWAWKCGDYSQIACAHRYPEFDHYWMIEPDVWFNFEEIGAFFAKCDADDSDFLCASFRKASPDWLNHETSSWWFREVWSCFYPITRLSRRAIRAVHEGRQSYIDSWKSQKRRQGEFANDEAFVASCMAANELKMTSLAELAPERFPGDWRSFSFRRTILLDYVASEGPHVLHPVLAWDAYKARAKRVHGPEALPFVGEVAKAIAARGDREDAQWVANSSYRLLSAIARGAEQDDEADSKSPRLHMITDRRRGAIWSVSKPGDFLVGPGQPIAKVDYRKMAPYAADYPRGILTYVDTTPDQVSGDPFLYVSQYENAHTICRAHLSTMPKTFLSEKGEGATFVFSIGRCGSTLVSTLTKAMNAPTYSECDAFLGLPAQPKNRTRVLQLMRCVLASLRAHSGGGSGLFIKMKADSNRDIEWFLEAFPKARFIFLGRELEPWAASYIKVFDWDSDKLFSVLKNGAAALKTLKQAGRLSSLLRYEEIVEAPMSAVTALFGEKPKDARRAVVRDAVAGDSQKGLLEKRDGVGAVVAGRVAELKDRLPSLEAEYGEELNAISGKAPRKPLTARLLALVGNR